MFDSPWLRHPRVWYVLALLFWLVTISCFVANREPPTEFLRQKDVPAGFPGETVRVEVPVRRNLERGCSVDSQRTFIDANHAAETSQPVQHVSNEGLALREKLTPGQLIFNVPIPKTAAPGVASIITENQYWCPANPTTWFVKIDTAWVAYVLVKGRE